LTGLAESLVTGSDFQAEDLTHDEGVFAQPIQCANSFDGCFEFVGDEGEVVASLHDIANRFGRLIRTRFDAKYGSHIEAIRVESVDAPKMADGQFITARD
jgi:hypothetical protein